MCGNINKIEFIVDSTQLGWDPISARLVLFISPRSSNKLAPSLLFLPPLSPSSPPPLDRIMLLGDPSNPASPSFSADAPATHRSYIPSLIPPGVDPAKVDSKMFYTYVPNTIKTRKRTTPAQLEILEGVFVTDKKPNAPRRKELAKKLKMSPREVQVRALSSSSQHPIFSLDLWLKKKPPSYSLFFWFLAERYGSKIGVLRRKSRLRKRTLHRPPPRPRRPSPPRQLLSPRTYLPPRTLLRTCLPILSLHNPLRPPSLRSRMRRPSRLHAPLRVLHGILHLCLRPPLATRLIRCDNNTMLSPLALPRRPAPLRMVCVVAPSLF